MHDFPGDGWGWKNLGDVGSVVCMLPKLRSRALCARERGASVEHRGVGRTAPANPSFERTPLRGCRTTRAPLGFLTMKIFCHQCGKHTNHNILAEEKVRSDEHDPYHWG